MGHQAAKFGGKAYRGGGGGAWITESQKATLKGLQVWKDKEHLLRMVMVCLIRRTQEEVMIVDRGHHGSFRTASQYCLKPAWVINIMQAFY